MNEFDLGGTSADPVVLVNGKPVKWTFVFVPVWPSNRIIRFIHRRILRRPPLRFRQTSAVRLEQIPPAGSRIQIVQAMQIIPADSAQTGGIPAEHNGGKLIPAETLTEQFVAILKAHPAESGDLVDWWKRPGSPSLASMEAAFDKLEAIPGVKALYETQDVQSAAGALWDALEVLSQEPK